MDFVLVIMRSEQLARFGVTEDEDCGMAKQAVMVARVGDKGMELLLDGQNVEKGAQAENAYI
jgi:hypothetical protein